MSKRITPDLAEDALREIEEEDESKMIEIMDRFQKEQPMLMGYVWTADEALFQGEAAGQLIFNTLWAWNCFQLLGCQMSEITDQQIEAVLGKVEKEVEVMSEATTKDMMDVAQEEFFKKSPQMDFMSMLVLRLMGASEEMRKVDDFVGMQVMQMKAIVELLDDAAQAKGNG
jgi:hypothetical protein